MTVAEFIEWLKTQDQDAEVECVVHKSGNSYYDQGGTCTTQPFSPELSDYTNFKGSPRVKETDPYFNKSYLLIGEM